MEAATASTESTERKIADNAVWYHALELAPGVVTPGQVDLRGLAPKVLPDDLSGRRCLDIATFDGFWAFEMEKRGGEVVAIDLETIDAAQWPPIHRERLVRASRDAGVELGRGFAIAKRALDSGVERIVCNAYDLTPERIGGPADFIFLGALLLHLRDPVAVLERARSTLAERGRMRILEPISIRNTIRAPRTPLARFSPLISDFTWWFPNYAALMAMPRAAGFRSVRRLGLHRPPPVSNPGMRNWCCAIEVSA